MLYHIVHTTTYKYSQPVNLEPHTLRLRPRSDGSQMLHRFELKVQPEPLGISQIVDLEGNNLVRVWFKEVTEQLSFKVTSDIETFRINPFDYLLEPWATHLPIDYPTSLLTQLKPYFHRLVVNDSIDPVAAQLAQEMCQVSDWNIVTFLGKLNQRIYQECQQITRENGDPFPPSLTWSRKLGSCRDFSVLFMECCRSVGLAARFVSGYQEGDLMQKERHLHAWAEVYLPGAGWRGYDPTHGLAVSDRHIALVASPQPRYASAVDGRVRPAYVQAAMQYELSIEKI